MSIQYSVDVSVVGGHRKVVVRRKNHWKPRRKADRSPSPVPIPPLPLSPPSTPDKAAEEVQTPRPVILTDVVGPRASATMYIPFDIPTVDSAITSPGFRPSDDDVVAQKRYWAEDEAEECYDDDGYHYSYYAPRPVFYGFTADRGRQMAKHIGALIDRACSVTGSDNQSALEHLLDYLLTADFMAEFFAWAPKFRDIMAGKVTEFLKNPAAGPRLKMLSQTVRNLYF